MLEDEPNNQTGSWHPLLKEVMKEGRAVASLSKSHDVRDLSPAHRRDSRFARLNDARDRALDQIGRLPDELLALDSKAQYPVAFSERLRREKDKLEQQILNRQATLE